jgi:hypothetical protein
VPIAALEMGFTPTKARCLGQLAIPTGTRSAAARAEPGTRSRG